jgi:hypothetical protein
MRFARRIATLVFWLFCSCRFAAACDPAEFALFKQDALRFDDVMSLALFNSVTADNFPQFKTSLQSWIPSPALSDLNYDDYRAIMEREIRHAGYYYTKDQSTQYIAQNLSGDAARLYRECMDREANLPGFHLWLGTGNAPYVNISAQWTGMDDKEAPLTGQVTDGVTFVSSIPNRWKPRMRYDLLMRRNDPSKTAIVLLAVNRDEKFLILRGTPAIKKYRTESIQSDDASISTRDIAVAVSRSQCIIADSGSYFIPETATIVTKRRLGERTSTRITSRDEYVICWEVSVSSDINNLAFVDISAAVSVLKRIPADR